MTNMETFRTDTGQENKKKMCKQKENRKEREREKKKFVDLISHLF